LLYGLQLVTDKIPAYGMGRVMRARIAHLDAFLAPRESSREPLGHLHWRRPAPPWGEGDDADGHDPEPDIGEGG
jgi:hypothetical protein